MLRATATVVTLLAAGATAAAAAQPAHAADPQTWQTPSGNVACITYEQTLRCDIRTLGRSAPRKPRGCQGDYGHAFAVSRASSRGRRLCVSDTAFGQNLPTVRYGRTWKRNGFTCTVRESGLRCTNARSHGFFLRIGKQQLL